MLVAVNAGQMILF